MNNHIEAGSFDREASREHFVKGILGVLPIAMLFYAQRFFVADLQITADKVAIGLYVIEMIHQGCAGTIGERSHTFTPASVPADIQSSIIETSDESTGSGVSHQESVAEYYGSSVNTTPSDHTGT